MNLASQGERLRDLLVLQWPPVAVAFREAPPPGVQRIEMPGPAGCAYWRLAAEGRVFYTDASDHFGCTIGSHTHGVDLPEDKVQELEAIVATMVGLEYIRMEEVAALPRRAGPFGVAVYAPLGQAPFEPDVILVRGNAKQIMLVAEAARAIGIAHEGAAMGRPACAMVPASLQSGHGALSLACIGNRVYTGLGDGELYFTVPGPRIAELVEKLETILQANQALERFHQRRRAGSN